MASSRSSFRLLRRAGASAGLLLCSLAVVRAQSDDPRADRHDPYEDVPSLRVPRIPDGVPAPAIDGQLDDEAWSLAAEVPAITQTVPVEGAAPSERTRFRLLYDARHVYLALECFDQDPEGIRATQRVRDARLDPDDRVEFFFDTFLDRRNAYWFQIGAAGSKGDGLISRNGGSFNKLWDGIWEGRARRTEEGWQAEIAIPFQTMNFDPNTTRFGFNLRRFVRRRSEEDRWAAPTPRISFFSIANAGVLEGFEGLDQGLGLDVVPFAVFDASRDRASDRDLQHLDGGLDLFYRLTPSFKLSASVNTDFAETEVDDRQVNLTRFPLFFPEKRAFFLEDSGSFLFGDSRRTDAIPFFSRRIGIDGRGEEVPLQAAWKLTGQTDRFRIGLLHVRTDAVHELDAEDLDVARVGMNVFEQSELGGILTLGDPRGGDRAATYGLDYLYRSDHFLGDRNFELGAWALETPHEGVHDDDLAYSLRTAYPNDEIDLAAEAVVVEERFDPALGFVPRRGVRTYRSDLRYRPRLHSAIRQLRFELSPRWTTDTRGALESSSFGVQPIGVLWESGELLTLRYDRQTEVFEEAFSIQRDVIVPADRYDQNRVVLDFTTSEARSVSGALQTGFGTYLGGRRTDGLVSIAARPGAWGTFGIDYLRNDVRLPEGSFVVRLVRFRGQFAFSPTLAWSNFVQYDNATESLGWNSRLWWILRPGRDVFLVLNQGYDDEPGHFAPTTTQFVAKVGSTFRF